MRSAREECMPIRVGMTLSGERLNRDNAKFAQQLGIEDVVVHLGRYRRAANPEPYLNGGEPGPILGDCSGEVLWTYDDRSEEHTSELQSLMRISYAVFCLKKKNIP